MNPTETGKVQVSTLSARSWHAKGIGGRLVGLLRLRLIRLTRPDLPERSREAEDALESRSRLVAEPARVPDQMTMAGDDRGVVSKYCDVAGPGRGRFNGNDGRELMAGKGGWFA